MTRSSAPTLVVLAAGLSSRYNESGSAGTARRLKQVDPMGPNGETLLDYSVYDAVRAGFGRVVFVIRREFEESFRQSVASRFAGSVGFECVFQDADDLPRERLAEGWAPAGRSKPWGTGHATLAARHIVHEPFGVINADDFYGRESFNVLAGFLTRPGLAAESTRHCMVAFTLRDTLSTHGSVARGVCVSAPDPGDPNSRLLAGVRELKALVPGPEGTVVNAPSSEPTESFTGDDPVSLNMWGFSPSIFPAFERVFAEFLSARGDDPAAEFYIPEALDRLIAAGEESCRVLRSSAHWFGITYREDVPHVRAQLAGLHACGEYPRALWT